MSYHTPVLLAETIRQLQPRTGGLYVDATAGGGGHTEAILQASAPDGRVIGLDWDEEALAASQARLQGWGERIQWVPANFSELRDVLARLQVGGVDGVLFDLGVSSRQFDEASRGFSFQREGPLDMRMSRQISTTARDVLATADEVELARIFFVYGEERRSRAIARRIVAERERGALPETTTELARLIERVLGPKRGPLHPATRVFQALRIQVNRERDNLRDGLVAAGDALQPGGRVAVISFHSLEDRIVKWFFREQLALRILTKKPVTAADEEVAANPRARSAKLRVAEKI